MLDSVSGLGILRVLVAGFGISAVAIADPCIAQGTRTGGAPNTTSKDPTTWNPTYIPSGMPGFGVSGPTDQDPGADMADDACLTLEFNVPAASPMKKGDGGWGALTLTFDRPIDGGSFVFDPVCTTPIDGTFTGASQGTSGQIYDPGGEPLSGPNQSIVFKPTVKGGKPYYALPTDSIADGFQGTQAPNYSQFAVTIMYDASQGAPQLQISLAGGTPLSYWVGKAGQQNGGFNSNNSTTGTQTLGIDYALAMPAPEPSFLIPLLSGCVVLLSYRRRRRTA